MNQHTYTEYVPSTTKTIVENLPEGRFLDKSEIIQDGDLCLNNNTRSFKTKCVGQTGLEAGGEKYYRPAEYYYLKEGETIKEGDEWQYYRGWAPIKSTEFATMPIALYSWHVGNCRRKIVEKKEEPKPATKFKVGDKVKILHTGRIGQVGVIAKIRENHGENSWRNVVKVENGDRPPYADSELELVEDVKPVKPLLKPKWRELGPDEIIWAGDQAYSSQTRGWANVNRSVGYTVRAWPVSSAHSTPRKRFRRKVI
jgi:hypothetical protein